MMENLEQKSNNFSSINKFASNKLNRSTNVDGTDTEEGEKRDIRGRSVFAVETTAAGVMVRTAFLGEQNELLEMPAVFPDLSYALNQIDELRRLIIDRFTQAAQVGNQVIAAQAAKGGQQVTSNGDEEKGSNDQGTATTENL